MTPGDNTNKDYNKIKKDAEIIWKLRKVFSKLDPIFQITFEDIAWKVMKDHSQLMEKLGPG